MLTGAFGPSQILVVTFTDKAAGEMRARLERLGAHGVQARTFHSAALAQLRYFAGDRIGQVLPSKALMLQPIRRSLPPPFKFRPLGDLAGEIEWAKNRRLTPETYLSGLDGHEPPIPPDLMVSVFRRYEAQKERQGRVDPREPERRVGLVGPRTLVPGEAAVEDQANESARSARIARISSSARPARTRSIGRRSPRSGLTPQSHMRAASGS